MGGGELKPNFPLSKIPLHCKKELAVFPSPAGMSLIKLFLGGNNLVFSRPERVWSLVSDIPAGDGKMANSFLQCSFLCPHEGEVMEKHFGRSRISAKLPPPHPFRPGIAEVWP